MLGKAIKFHNTVCHVLIGEGMAPLVSQFAVADRVRE